MIPAQMAVAEEGVIESFNRLADRGGTEFEEVEDHWGLGNVICRCRPFDPWHLSANTR